MVRLEDTSGAASLQRSPGHVYLDGRTLEGGGQLVRNALALSALTGRPVTIDHVRGNRSGKTGLKASHTAAVNLLAEISGSVVDGGRVGSQSVIFSPRLQSYEELVPSNPAGAVKDARLVSLIDIAVQPEYNIRLPTPGSVFLIFQALYPYLLHIGSRSSTECIKVTITGGTNGTNSPSYDYASQVMVPNFARLGLPPLSITLHKRGWSTGIVAMGTVSFFIHPLANTEDVKTMPMQPRFPRINILDYERGRITRFDLTVLAPDESFTQKDSSEGSRTLRKYIERQTRRVLRRALKTLDPSIFGVTPYSELHGPVIETADENSGQDTGIPIEIHTSEATSHISRLYILLVAHTSTGFRIGHDILGHSLGGGSGKGKKHGKPQRGQEGCHKGGSRQKTDLEIVDDLIDECVQGIVKERTHRGVWHRQ